MTTTTWHIGQLLNAIQSTFVGLLRVLSIPIVLALSVAEGYNTWHGLSYFIPQWIALIMTIAVQSMIVICTLELASMHWRANLVRYLSVVLSLLVALTVSISFAYFRFYEFSQRDVIQLERQTNMVRDANRYIESVVALKSQLTAAQQKRVEHAAEDANRAYLGTHPGMQGQIGKGKVWNYYNEILQDEQNKLQKLENAASGLEKRLSEVREALREFSLRVNNSEVYERLVRSVQNLQGEAEILASAYGAPPVEAPRFGSYAEFSLGLTPSFAMWKNISWFTLALAGMVDFFILFLSYRLETTAPGPLTEEEKDLAYYGIRQFSEFTINANDELEFSIEKTELERARRYSDWSRMFSVAFLLNRGYLRKVGDKSVEFAPNLYPIIAERLKSDYATESPKTPANESELTELLARKGYV
ncbi:hypothetical protein [Methylocaldum szegediense]|uniref:DUF4407 domain-containing protein n=1 Tax=Methylocaldum szegediense TaxID=73780 RepID=A0ABN8XCD8_9GAMM|nr:hypothetical protein [Methylocaldum szegediense]CAI8967501.1 conserved membrane protein of unknown function [Methylocaldum szegediense]